MEKVCISKNNLKMMYMAQKGVRKDYRQGQIDIEDSIVEQSIDLLEGYAQGEIIIADSDLFILEQISKSLLNVVPSSKYQEIYAIHQKLKQKVQKIQDEKRKYSNFEQINSIINNKKQAQSISMENLTQARKTVLADKEHSPKQKQRILQQLQSYALIKFGETKGKIDKNFAPYRDFVNTFGFSHQRFSISKPQKVFEKQENIDISKKSRENPLKKISQKIGNGISRIFQKVKTTTSNMYHKYEPYIAVGAIFITGILGWKMMEKTSDLYPQASHQVRLMPEEKDSASNDKKTADYSVFAQKMKQENKEKIMPKNQNVSKDEKKSEAKSKTTVAEDYYDTALQIHLGSKDKVQQLYNKIDSLANEGKIKFSEGLNTKRYAHAFTMYNLIRPNSAENKIIKNLLSGGKENPELINRLVLKAKAKGQGIKSDNRDNKNSNFDKASKNLQIMHMKNLQVQR